MRFSIAAYHQIVSVCIDVPYKPWGRLFCGEMRVFCHNMFVKVYFINMRSDLNINDFIKNDMSKGALLFQSEDLLILVQKSRLQIFQIESGNIFSESE